MQNSKTTRNIGIRTIVAVYKDYSVCDNSYSGISASNYGLFYQSLCNVLMEGNTKLDTHISINLSRFICK